MRKDRVLRGLVTAALLAAIILATIGRGSAATPLIGYHIFLQVQSPATAVPGTQNSTFTWVPLWTSPTQFIRWDCTRQGMVLVNVQTGQQEPLDEVNALIKQDPGYFDVFSVRLSPDGQWLLWPSGSKQNPTWTATTLDGSQLRQWARHSPDDLAQVAWMCDSTHWVELSQTPWSTGEALARVYSIASPGVQEFPLHLTPNVGKPEGTLVIWPPAKYSRFLFKTDGRAWITQMWSGASSPSNPQVAGSRADLYEIVPGPSSWTMRETSLFMGAYQDVGGFDECTMSPDGGWLIWRNYNADGTGPMRFMLSRSDGSGMQTIYQAPPASGSLQWAPDEQEIAFYSWDQNCSTFLLPLASAEARLPRSLPSRIVGRTQPHGKFPTRTGGGWPGLKQVASK